MVPKMDETLMKKTNKESEMVLARQVTTNIIFGQKDLLDVASNMM